MIIDLFAGPGGWDVAARELGLDPVGFEIDAAAIETRSAAGFITDQRDVASIDLAEFERPITGLIASPPCQAFSAAGKQKGKLDIDNINRCAIQLANGLDHRAEYEWADDRAPLVLEPLRWVLGLRPEWTCWEQVPPVLPFWELCAKLIAQYGYSVWTGYLHAEQFGVPQTRKRAFLIASRAGDVVPPTPTHSRYYPRDRARLDHCVEKWVSMAEALGWGAEARPAPTVTGGGCSRGGPEPFARGGRAALTAAQGSGEWVSRAIHERAFDVNAHDGPPAENSLPPEAPAPRVFTTASAPQPSASAILRSGQSVAGVGRAERSVEAPALTVTGRSDLWSFLTAEPVRVTVEQAACLQSFPDGFPWRGSRSKQFEQVGNAVPPLLALPVLRAALAAGNPFMRWDTEELKAA